MTPRSFTALCFAALLAVACERAADAPTAAQGPAMQAPTPDSEPGRVFTPESENARATTGRLTLTMTTRMSSGDNQGPIDVLTLRAQTGLSIDAELESAAAPSLQVENQTLRALMDLPVEASQTLVYRVTEEAGPQGGRRLCGERATTRIVVWEPDGPGASGLRMLALAGEAAPGRPGAVLCGALTYARAEG